MKLKSYFSDTVQAAMDLARRELGDEALLINSRPATPDTRYLGAYEVVFGVAPGVAPGAAAATLQARPPARPPARLPARIPTVPHAQPADQFIRDLAGFRIEMESLRASLRSAVVPAVNVVATDATLGVPGSECAVVALVGPPGAGKTTTLIKLAAHYGLAGRKRTQILSADVHRIGAADQLRALASILGLGCEVVPTPLALSQAIAEHRSKHLILIDTPGLSAREMEDGAGLAQLLASHPDVDTHLVLAASMQPASLARIAAQYAVFRPRKLIFTRVDEIDESDLASQAARCSLPVSFLCAGQQIPDDIEPATRLRTTQEQHALGATA